MVLINSLFLKLRRHMSPQRSKIIYAFVYRRYYLMYFTARFIAVRKIMRVVFSKLENSKTKPNLGGITLFPDLDTKRVVADLNKEGCHLGIMLPDTATEEILEWVSSAIHYGDQDERLGFLPEEKQLAERVVGKKFAIARLFNTVAECDMIRKISEDSKLREIASEYLGGCTPKFLGVHMRWSYPHAVSKDELDKMAQIFHTDIDDYTFVKIFFYLSDVDQTSGPHSIVKTSHRKKSLVNQLLGPRRFTDDEVRKIWGKENVVTIEGPKGYGFSADTYCLHKGTHPTKKPRLLLEFEYGIFDYSRRTPSFFEPKGFMHKHDERLPEDLRRVLDKDLLS